MMELLLDRLDNLADSSEPAAPWLRPQDLTVALRRIEVLGTTALLPCRMVDGPSKSLSTPEGPAAETPTLGRMRCGWRGGRRTLLPGVALATYASPGNQLTPRGVVPTRYGAYQKMRIPQHDYRKRGVSLCCLAPMIGNHV